jgi:ribose/xylose/arabinose/galactoside ABC-type transport system permease subunit
LPGWLTPFSQPIEGVGWRSFTIASVAFGGTLLTGRLGSVLMTLSLGVVFNVLNLENGRGWISHSARWQSVIRGVFLLAVVLILSSLARNRRRQER